MTSRTGGVGGGFGEILKKLVELRTRLRTGRVDFRGSLRPDEFVRYGRHTCCGGWGADGKASIERLCISLPYVETFNSKVIKGFVPELRSRYVFFVFRDSYVLCICVMNILCTFHAYPYPAMVQQYRQHKHQQSNNQKTKRGRKTTVWIFQVTKEISYEKTWTWLRKGNLKRKTESLLIAAQNNAIRTTSKQK